tara:strand:- start:2316 stop:2747 length:432 start_codon:yes stop_codon:yes gene_type:complete
LDNFVVGKIMTIHLKKLAVGITSIEELIQRQKDIFTRYGEIIHITRNRPQKYLDLINGGSIYWVIKRKVRVRQRILEVKELITNVEKKSTGIILENKLVKVRPTPMKPFQGWRYYKIEEIPPDIKDDDFSDDFNYELSKLGLY